MARKLRIEEEGGIYHVINRGNYRRWLFEEEGAKKAFEGTLFEACERNGWVLHAFCIMGNHYHLALETPGANLSEGMRWLQSAYANRFNRFRTESGRLFQGRFKSLGVESSERLAWLCHYIHLNPARAGICPVMDLPNYRWTSVWYLNRPELRHACMDLSTSLEGAGALQDNEAGWKDYTGYLTWLGEDEPMQKQMEFARMSRGWAIGSKAFKRAWVADEKQLRSRVKLTQAKGREMRELAWEAQLDVCLRELGKTAENIESDAKAAHWKVAVAAWLKNRMACPNGWLGRKLNMGVEFGVSRYVSAMRAGARPAAREFYELLCARVKH